MKKKARIIIISVIAVILLVLLFAAFMFVNAKRNDNSVEVKIYYLDHISNELRAEKRHIPVDDHGSMAESVLNRIKENPNNKKLSKTKPENLALLSAKLVNDNTFEVDFSAEYKDMSSIQEIFFRAAFVWSITELDFIEQVKITVEGEELIDGLGRKYGYFTRSNIVVNPVVSPVKDDEIQTAVLYFTDSKSAKLISETRNISVNPDKPVEYFIIEQLIAGPQEAEHYPTVPPDTKIRDVKSEQGTCYINLSTEFLVKQVGDAGTEKISVYSIVNSLTELPGIDYVQFFIESRKDDIKKGAVSLGNPLERDESLVD